jgi:hypothetical protein
MSENTLASFGTRRTIDPKHKRQSQFLQPTQLKTCQPTLGLTPHHFRKLRQKICLTDERQDAGVGGVTISVVDSAAVRIDGRSSSEIAGCGSRTGSDGQSSAWRRRGPLHLRG